MKLKDILLSTNVDIEISGISYNSKLTKPGDVFVAITGFQTDGHKYIKSAVENGAVCVVCEREQDDVDIPCVIVENSRKALAEMSCKFYGNPTEKFNLIGVTGTNGKTTVTYLVKTVLEANGEKVGLMGTNKNMIGDVEYHTERTTPESLELQQFFADMVKEGCTYGIMEVSSHSLELYRVFGCNYKVGAFTNLTQDHLDFHGDMENYFIAKSKLFNMCGTGVINADDIYGARLCKQAGCQVMSYGIKNGDLKAENIEYNDKGVRFECGSMKINLGIPGVFSVYNALTAIGICKSCGISDEVIEKALNSAQGVKGRAEIVDCGKDFTLLIDYAHTPDGLENILESVRKFAKGPLGRGLSTLACSCSLKASIPRCLNTRSDSAEKSTASPSNAKPMSALYLNTLLLKFSGYSAPQFSLILRPLFAQFAAITFAPSFLNTSGAILCAAPNAPSKTIVFPLREFSLVLIK